MTPAASVRRGFGRGLTERRGDFHPAMLDIRLQLKVEVMNLFARASHSLKTPLLEARELYEGESEKAKA
jgi:hypothetical protein